MSVIDIYKTAIFGTINTKMHHFVRSSILSFKFYINSVTDISYSDRCPDYARNGSCPGPSSFQCPMDHHPFWVLKYPKP